MTVSEDLLKNLRTWHRMPARQLLDRLQVSRATLMRAVQALGPGLIVRGRARRTAYAARRALRGRSETLPLFQIDLEGRATEVAALHLAYPAGCAVDYLLPFDWPLDDDMVDGWFDGLPYPLDDMRPQGFLGRNFAHQHANLLQVSEDPQRWSEDDLLHTLSLMGADQPGNYILGEPAYRQWLAQSQQQTPALGDEQIESAYPALAEASMAFGAVGSSVGGEFPKFTARRNAKGQPFDVIVKFSGSDNSPGTQRWADLLVCEHLASVVLGEALQMEAAASCIHQFGGRTFLEVRRFDRHGLLGRSPVCSWAALNAALFGLTGKPWTIGAAALFAKGYIDSDTRSAIERLWYFGQLIANNDMHDGNLSFRPGLRLAPVYDMLPMLYAPVRGVELPARTFAPPLPLPCERDAWMMVAKAAMNFWALAAGDARISAAFRQICARNALAVQDLAASPVLKQPN